MPARFRGPLMEDYVRALKAAKRMGVKAVRVEVGQGAIVMVMDDNYLDRLAQCQPPAPDVEVGEKPKARW